MQIHGTFHQLHRSSVFIEFFFIDNLLTQPFSTITMQLQENPARVLLRLHGNSTEGFLLKNLYCLECSG